MSIQRIFSPLNRATLVGCVVILLQACEPVQTCLSCEETAETFLSELESGATLAAYQVLVDELPVVVTEERLNSLVNASNIQLKRFGNPEGFELVETQPRGSRVLTLSYFLYQPARVSRWQFDFYRSGNDWVLMNFSVGDEFTQFR